MDSEQVRISSKWLKIVLLPVMFVAGVARRPEDVAASVRDATGAAGKAFASAMRSA